MALTDVIKHGEVAKADLPAQFKGEPAIEGLLEAIAPQLEELDAVWLALVVDRFIDNAVGAQLDQLAKRFKLKRGSSDDEQLRARIRAEVRLNLGSGTVEDLLEVLVLVLGVSAGIDFRSYYPASFLVDVGQTSIPEILANLVARARLGGVRADVVYSSVPADQTFTFASGDAEELGAPNLAANPGLEAGDVQWVKEGTWAIVNDPANARSGGWCARAINPTTAALRNGAYNSIPAQPGAAFYAQAWIKSSAGATASAHVRIDWYTAAGAEISQSGGNQVTATTSYKKSSVAAVAPAGTAFARLEVVVFSSTGTWYADDCVMTGAAGQGWADDNKTIGGYFADVMEA